MAKAEAEAVQKAEDVAREYVEATTIRTEELAGRGLDLAEQAADRGDAKSFALAASGFKVFDQVTRKGYGLDAQQISADALTAIFARPMPVEVNVTPPPAQIPEETTGEDIEGI